MTEERDARRDAVAIIEDILRQPRVDPNDQLVKDLRAQLEILGLEDELERFSWRRDRRNLMEEFQYFKQKLKLRDYPEKHERKRARRAFDHEVFQEQVIDFRSPQTRKIKRLEKQVQELELERRRDELIPKKSWSLDVVAVLCILVVGGVIIVAMMAGDGSPQFTNAGTPLSDGIWSGMELLVGAGICWWVVYVLFGLSKGAPKQ